jgi:hypothetical protein
MGAMRSGSSAWLARCGDGWRPRAVGFVVALAIGALVTMPVAAQEPPVLTGPWIGAWWMGKYEKPVELELTQTRGEVTGQVMMWGYPGTGVADAAVRAAVTGTVDGRRVRLSWILPQQGRFSVELTLLTPDRLFGAGGPGFTTAGFDLRRSR